AERAVDMTDRNEYWLKAQKYEEQAKLVRDAWVKERLRVLARHWREAAEQEEGGSSSENGDQMTSHSFFAEPGRHGLETIKPRTVSGQVGKLMERNAVEMRRRLERGESRQADVIIRRPVVRFPKAFPDAGAATREEFIDRTVALVRVADLDGP